MFLCRSLQNMKKWIIQKNVLNVIFKKWETERIWWLHNRGHLTGQVITGSAGCSFAGLHLSACASSSAKTVRDHWAVEGWRHRLRSLFLCHHPTVWTFMRGIQREIQRQKGLLLQATTGITHPSSAKKYRALSWPCHASCCSQWTRWSTRIRRHLLVFTNLVTTSARLSTFSLMYVIWLTL